MNAHHGPDTHDNPETHHEGSDVNVRAVFAFGAGLIAIAIVVHVAVWLLYMLFAAQENRAQGPREYPMAIKQEDRLPAEPRLQTSPREDLRDLRTREDAILNTYGWVDRNVGVVRVPIGEAMKLTLKQGLPARAAAPAGSGSGQATAATESSKQK